MKGSRGGMAMTALAAAGLLATVGAGSVILASDAGPADQGPRVSDDGVVPLAPELELALYQGRGVDGSPQARVSDYRGRPVVLNFWAVWCPPCRVEMPALDAMYRDLREAGLVVLGADVGTLDPADAQEAVEFLSVVGATFPSGWVELDGAAARFELQSLPTTVFIKRDGTIHRRWVGYLDGQNLRALVSEIVEE